MGGGLPAAEHLHCAVGGHIQIKHQVGPGQAQLGMLKIVQPAQKIRAFFGGALGPLMDGVGGGVSVGEDQSALLIVVPPVLLEGCVAVDGVKAEAA